MKHSGNRDAFLAAYHQERSTRRRWRRRALRALLPRRRSPGDRALAAVAEATLTGEDR